MCVLDYQLLCGKRLVVGFAFTLQYEIIWCAHSVREMSVYTACASGLGLDAMVQEAWAHLSVSWCRSYLLGLAHCRGHRYYCLQLLHLGCRSCPATSRNFGICPLRMGELEGGKVVYSCVLCVGKRERVHA